MKFSEMDMKLANRLAGIGTHPQIGGDPEFFIATSRGKILNADQFFPAKHEPIIIGDRGNNASDRLSKIFFDGIQGEIAIAHSSCRDTFISNIQTCLVRIHKQIDDHRLVLKPSARIQRAIINKADPEARIFGCMPDYSAYTLSTNTCEMDASRHPFRYAGGHMHFGMSSPYLKEGMKEYDLAMQEENHIRIIRFFDMIITIPTLILDNGPGSKRRRDKYGKAGCFRPTPYGVEYRTPSCWWLQSPLTTSLIYGLGKLAWSMLMEELDEPFRNAIEPDEQTIRGIIDESDTRQSYKMWKKMMPYLAVAGKARVSPVNFGSMYSDQAEEHPHMSEYVSKKPALKGNHIHSLAVFEYMLKNGLFSTISRDIKKEWRIGSKSRFSGSSGFIYGNYRNLNESKDFMKFQDSFINELY